MKPELGTKEGADQAPPPPRRLRGPAAGTSCGDRLRTAGRGGRRGVAVRLSLEGPGCRAGRVPEQMALNREKACIPGKMCVDTALRKREIIEDL